MMINGNLKLKRSMKRAGRYDEWIEAARAFDQYNGLDRWRKRDQTRQYDYVSIRTRLDRLRSLKARHDIILNEAPIVVINSNTGFSPRGQSLPRNSNLALFCL